MKQKPLISIQLIALALTITTALATSSYGDDSAFNQGHWREALMGYQLQVYELAKEQKITLLKPEAFFSTVVESESDNLLKAHCLFERGAIDYLKNDNQGAATEWDACRNTLNTNPMVGALYQRRVNMALAQLWVEAAGPKDLKFFDEGLSLIAKTIDDAPLPEDTVNFRYQLKQEYWFTSAELVMSVFHSLSTKTENQTPSTDVIAQKLTELWSKKALFLLLANEKTDISKSHEALVDKMIFADTAHHTSEQLYKKLIEAWKSLPPQTYSATAALMCVYAVETGSDGLLQSLLKNDVDSKKLDPVIFGNEIYRTLKIATNFRSSDKKKLIQGISKRLDLMTWPDPMTRIEMAMWIAKAGNGTESLQLLKPLTETTSDSPIYPSLCCALTEVFYLTGDFKKSLAASAEFSEKNGKEIPPDLFYWRALSFAKIQKQDDTIKSLKIFLSRAPEAPEAPEACFFLAMIYLTSGKKLEAQRYFQQTVISYVGSSYAERAKAFSKILPN